ncbi:DUF3888 domain-containing protein [Aquibacillus sp. 3ASR75-11]|uniref:DUF3888 domain-containing protein n=1 Tax=Terrihalobacillus insolitus TaxID=2950438 RepID=A0A9X3WS36_9BACI|nr:DUF3888 domain-containing protein [Terrihalobacillus insolitus]MDC3423648.1 DUF3888 domain-containing protein [Terrihalobacillus insolitus]
MKKKLLLIIAVFYFFIGFNPSIGNAKEFKQSYCTAEDVLLEMLKPDIDTIIMDKYGKTFSWDYTESGGLVDLKLVHDLSIPKWFEATLSVESKEIGKENPKRGQSIIRLKIIPASFSRNDNAVNKVKVINFQDARKVD